MSQRSGNYEFTLPVVKGQIQDPDNRLVELRQEMREMNRALRATYALTKKRSVRSPLPIARWVFDVKFRGPRHGDGYMSPAKTARAVDVYRRFRRTWED